MALGDGVSGLLSEYSENDPLTPSRGAIRGPKQGLRFAEEMTAAKAPVYVYHTITIGVENSFLAGAQVLIARAE